MVDLLIGPLALATRYGLVFIAGMLVKAGIALFDPATGVISIQVDSAANIIAAGVIFVGALLWRRIVVRLGGKT